MMSSPIALGGITAGGIGGEVDVVGIEMVERKEGVGLVLVDALRVVLGIRMVDREEDAGAVLVLVGARRVVVGVEMVEREGKVGEEGVAEGVVVVVEITGCGGGEESGDGGTPGTGVGEEIVAGVMNLNNLLTILTYITYLY